MNLSYLDLSWNSLNHKAYWISGFLCRLKSLRLVHNQFHGDNSEAFTNISECSSHNLESLELGSNEFHGHVPEELGALKQLKELGVSGNQLSGEIAISLGSLSNLEKIDISNNTFEGTLSDAHFVRLSKLVRFDARYNYMLKFRVSYNWVPPCQLKYLNLRSVQIGGQIPDWLQTQKAITELDFSNCSITGTLPKWLSSFMNLTRLDLSDNYIEGPIPDSLCQMKSLIFLDLSKNHLSGNLPDCWGNFESLGIARLSSNQFSGDIPNSIGGAYNLQFLHLDNNSFTGQLPTMKNCSRLILLDVGENKLSGKLPELYIGQYPDGLRFLRLRNNELYDIIPSSYCQLYNLQILER